MSTSTTFHVEFDVPSKSTRKLLTFELKVSEASSPELWKLSDPKFYPHKICSVELSIIFIKYIIIICNELVACSNTCHYSKRLIM